MVAHNARTCASGFSGSLIVLLSVTPTSRPSPRVPPPPGAAAVLRGHSAHRVHVRAGASCADATTSDRSTSCRIAAPPGGPGPTGPGPQVVAQPVQPDGGRVDPPSADAWRVAPASGASRSGRHR
ncbi:hypothetical protein GCM10022243_42330 [Saccharothrix violaceirubra]